MYQKHHNGQLSIEEFHVPFGCTLDPYSRGVMFSSLMPWEELEETYASQFSPATGAAAKPVRLAFGSLFIKQRLGMSEEETGEQIRENHYLISKKTPQNAGAALGMVGSSPQLSGASDAMSSD